MIGQTEVIVGAKIQDGPAIRGGHAGILRARDDAFPLEESGRLNAGQFRGEMFLERRVHTRISFAMLSKKD